VNLSSPQPHSIWLCPEADHFSLLRREIESLSHFSGTAPFDPHVTLIGDLSGAPERTVSACAAHLQHLGPIRAKVRDIAQTDAFFMALFLDLSLTPDLRAARDLLCRLLGAPPAGPFRPHLSLAYGASQSVADAGSLRKLHASYEGAEVPLTRIVVAASSRGLPIAEWRSLKTLELR
jgi:2'-5' RNA ligase